MQRTSKNIPTLKIRMQRQRSKTDLAGFVEGGGEDLGEPGSSDNLGKTVLVCLLS